jgi:hypothetical protein
MIVVWLAASPALGSELVLNVADKEPPQAFDASIREVLQPKAVQLLDGDQPVYEFWFRKTVPLKGKPESAEDALKSVTEATLLAAAVVTKSQRDYRDDQLYADTYTVRFSLQPQDGNHLGTAEFPYFVALVPVKLDKSLDAITSYKELVDASSQETATDHPIIMSLRPVGEVKGDYPRLHQPAPDHKSILVKLPAQAGGESAELVFNLVYEGVSIH